MTIRLMQPLAVGLSALAGFVDAIGYLALGNLFVAFMSGNSTVLGTAIAEEMGDRSRLAVGLVACFVMGVMAGTWVGRPLGDRRAPAVLLTVALLLAGAALLGRAGLVTPCCLVVALAMGTENTVFQRDHGPAIGLTYMTGTLVRLGQRVAEGFVGGAWRAVIPDSLLWLAMVVGAGAGAATYRWVELGGLWIAVGLAAAMAAIAWFGQRLSVAR